MSIHLANTSWAIQKGVINALLRGLRLHESCAAVQEHGFTALKLITSYNRDLSAAEGASRSLRLLMLFTVIITVVYCDYVNFNVIMIIICICYDCYYIIICIACILFLF